ncbi:putative glycosyltransferase [Nocardioides sp. LS1]|nr:putative glycosyltransferase [Nocardioides sp. LS1]
MGFQVRIGSDVRAVDGGRVLIGGSPVRFARLSDRGRALVENDTITVTDEPSRLLADRLLDGNLAAPVLPPRGADAAAELTVVIPIRDRVEQLDRLLALLRPALECIVVDDASHDRDAVAACARRHGARLDSHAHNLGPAAARNTGLRAASTPFVAFVDSDVSVDPRTLLDLCGHFADPRVAAVAPRIRGNAATARARWFQRYDEVSQSLDLGARNSLVRPGSTVSWLPSACLVVRTDHLGEGFDEALRVAEDVDLVWRLVAEGHRVRYDGDLEARHDSRDTLRSWLGRKAYYGTGGALLAARHGNLVAPAVMSPTYALAAVSLAAQRRWSIPVAIACAALTTHRVRRALPLEQGRTREAGRLAVLGLASAVSQSASLTLRHWWPAVALAAPFSKRARRAIALAATVDAVLTPRPMGLGRGELFAGRRLDDLAYGAGLWTGAARAHSLRALVPRITSRHGHTKAGISHEGR